MLLLLLRQGGAMELLYLPEKKGPLVAPGLHANSATNCVKSSLDAPVLPSGAPTVTHEVIHHSRLFCARGPRVMAGGRGRARSVISQWDMPLLIVSISGPRCTGRPAAHSGGRRRCERAQCRHIEGRSCSEPGLCYSMAGPEALLCTWSRP